MSSTTEHHDVPALDDDERLAIQAERDFLLASLDDLDTALADGDLDPGDHQRLHDDYTARAAAAARSLGAGLDQRPATPPPPPWRRAVVVLTVAAFALGAAFLLTRSMGPRLSGQTVTGNAQSGLPGLVRQLEQRVKDNPGDPAAHRDLAQARLQNRDFVGALKEFDAAARLDPGDAQSQTYAGWIVYQAGFTDKALGRLDAAIAAAPDYPDAHLFRGIVLLRARNDPPGAVAELERYLSLVPAGPLDADVRALLADARQKATAPPSPSSTTAPPAGGTP